MRSELLTNVYSAKHEYVGTRDIWGRSPSFLQDNVPKLSPILSEYLYSQGFRPTYPDGKAFSVCMSHDVDWIHQPLSRTGFLKAGIRSMMRGDMKGTAFAGANLIAPVEKPEWHLQRLIEREAERGVSATYFFLALEKEDRDYNYSMDLVERCSREIFSRQNEIGLHGGHEATVNQGRMALEKSRLERAVGRPVTGYRSHYLKFVTPNTWHELAGTGFEYDSTYGFADLAGYRNGLCYPFRPYDQVAGQFIDMIEIPLIVMDVTLWKYMNLGLEASFELFCRLVDDVERLNGVFTLLWHNHSFSGDEGKLYTMVMEYLIERDPWFATSRDVAQHWRNENLPAMEAMLPME